MSAPYPSPQEVAPHIERQLSALLHKQLDAGEKPFPLEVYQAVDAGVFIAFLCGGGDDGPVDPGPVCNGDGDGGPVC